MEQEEKIAENVSATETFGTSIEISPTMTASVVIGSDLTVNAQGQGNLIQGITSTITDAAGTNSRIKVNNTTCVVHNSLLKSNSKIENSDLRLSSGRKINLAEDDPSGYISNSSFFLKNATIKEGGNITSSSSYLAVANTDGMIGQNTNIRNSTLTISGTGSSQSEFNIGENVTLSDSNATFTNADLSVGTGSTLNNLQLNFNGGEFTIGDGSSLTYANIQTTGSKVSIAGTVESVNVYGTNLELTMDGTIPLENITVLGSNINRTITAADNNKTIISGDLVLPDGDLILASDKMVKCSDGTPLTASCPTPP
ncbi:MAG: hypothetical protein RLZ12_551 [Bacillota bacterium]|jgi:hypothetical protein